jgi:hypothetical protein
VISPGTIGSAANGATVSAVYPWRETTTPNAPSSFALARSTQPSRLKRDPREFLGIEIAEAVPRRTRAVVHFKKKKTVQMETAKALGELILAAQRAVLAAEDQVGR